MLLLVRTRLPPLPLILEYLSQNAETHACTPHHNNQTTPTLRAWYMNTQTDACTPNCNSLSLKGMATTMEHVHIYTLKPSNKKLFE